MPERKRILVVDDEESARSGLQELIESWGFETEAAEDGRTALDKIKSFRPHLILTDLVMPRMDAIALLKKVDLREVQVILLTAQGSIDSAVEAIKLGAYDYLTKPVDIVRLKRLLEHLAEKLDTDEEVKRLRYQLRQLGSFGRLHGTSPAMQELFRQIEVAAPSSASVLIAGSSGTGKELVARTIHDLSPRRNAPFIAINCSAIPATLLESELFGHERGAFTGAVKTKEGCFELADGGTLFLDEIATMALELQTKLLRVLENGRFRRVGGRDELHANVRLIAASNIRFDDAIRDAVFREDLYYRLNVFQLSLPTLRERVADIPLLAQHFVDEMSERNHKEIRSIHPDAMNCLKHFAWPGNVRELKNTIERAVIVAREKTILLQDLPEAIRQHPAQGPVLSFPVGTPMDEIEKTAILRTLDLTGGNKTEAAKLLGLSLKTLHNKVNQYRARPG
ncbi:MAG: sigma-54 dependent transcriptional regulator [Pseudomonadota bacterium]